MKILAGVDTDFVGETHVSPGYTIGYLEQEPELEKGKTVKEIVSEGVKEITDLLQEFDEVNEAFGDPDADFDKLCNRQADIQEKLDALDAWNLDANLELAMDALRCPPPEQSVDVLSGGEKRRVALCRLLLQNQIFYFLTNRQTTSMQKLCLAGAPLTKLPGTIIAITHDRYFLDNVAGWILELDRGEGFPYKGNYSGWLEQKKQRLALEEKGESDRQKALQKELDWIQMTPKGRQAKHKEHITKYEQLLNESGREKLRDTKITIPAGPRLGNLVVEAKDLTKGYGERLLFDNLSFTVPAGAIVGIVGPNGAGKTTLFRLIADAAGQTVERLDGTEGGEKPDAGELRVGESVKLTYVDQMRSLLDPEKTVWEQLSDGLDIIKLGAVDEKGRALNGAIREVNSRAYCSWFNFSVSDQQKKVFVLSGGERNRLNLAMMLKQGANLLLLTSRQTTSTLPQCVPRRSHRKLCRLRHGDKP